MSNPTLPGTGGPDVVVAAGPLIWRQDHLVRLARLVHQLRAVQKKSGKGYSTPAAGQQATNLEKQVDDALFRILGV